VVNRNQLKSIHLSGGPVLSQLLLSEIVEENVLAGEFAGFSRSMHVNEGVFTDWE
jgi:hypothetical protein